MLSEYERKAIKYLSQFEGNYVKTVLNLITKLQKENKHWKKGFEKGKLYFSNLGFGRFISKF